MLRLVITGFLVGGILLGCASTPRYTSSHDENVTINVDVDGGGLFTSVDMAAGVNDLDADCQPHYRGAVELSPGANPIGLAPGVLTYLMVDIAYSRPGASSNFGRGTVLRPMPGKQYEVDIAYHDNMYDFRLFEVSGSKRQEMQRLSLDEGCRRETVQR